jgi:methionyl-tRNA synthetase
MKVVRTTDLETKPFYGVDAASLPLENALGGSVITVKPGQASQPHAHHDSELFTVLAGRGFVVADGERHAVQAGDVILSVPFERHSFVNKDSAEDLKVACYWWTSPEAIQASLAAPKAGPKRSLLVTATPPTPNGDLHLGHLSGPYLAMDALRRHGQMSGTTVKTLSYSDDHQSYVALTAHRQGTTPEAIASRFAQRMGQTLAAAGMELEAFPNVHDDAAYAAFVRGFFARLEAKGLIEVREVMQPYCATCEAHRSEAYVRGSCPHCKKPSDGNACEACGLPNDCDEMTDASCAQCGEELGRRVSRRLYFKWSALKDQVRAHVVRATMSPQLRAMSLRMLAHGMDAIPASMTSPWGLEVPDPAFAGQRIYVWLEMAAGYLYQTAKLPSMGGASWEQVWKSADWAVVQCFGLDNGYFHTVLMPAAWLAFDPEIRLPSTYVTNEFYRLEGKKFSTSRGHAVWGGELLTQVAPDAMRFHLALTRPEAKETDFYHAEFAGTLKSVLEGELAGLGRSLAAAAARFGGRMPEAGAWDETHKAYFRRLERASAAIRAAYAPEAFSLRQVAHGLAKVVEDANALLAAHERSWSVAAERDFLRTTVALAALGLKTFAELAAPLAPAEAQKAWALLGFSGSPMAAGDALTFVPPGQALCAPAPLPADGSA